VDVDLSLVIKRLEREKGEGGKGKEETAKKTIQEIKKFEEKKIEENLANASTQKTYGKAVKGKIVRGGKALVVEDDEDWRETVCEDVKKSKLFTEILPAGSFMEAMSLFKENVNEITFISTDMSFPGPLRFSQQEMGRKLVEEIRETGYQGPIFVVSGSSINLGGIDRYISKREYSRKDVLNSILILAKEE
jgi:hypothetical protein